MIHVKDNYFIDADLYNIKLIKITDYTNEKGESAQRSEVVGYYSTVESALLRLLDIYYRDYINRTDSELYESIVQYKTMVQEFKDLYSVTNAESLEDK